MKQIVDKLNKIAKKIDGSVEIPQTDLIIDSLDAITKAYGGTPNDSHLIVDKLEDIYNNISSAPSGNIEITENTAEGEPLDVSQYATATVNVAGGGGLPTLELTIINSTGEDISPSLDNGLFIVSGNGITEPKIATNETIVINAVYYYVNILGDDLYFVNPILEVNSESVLTYTYSNLVNCTNEYSQQLDITNPAQNSSATLTITLGGSV